MASTSVAKMKSTYESDRSSRLAPAALPSLRLVIAAWSVTYLSLSAGPLSFGAELFPFSPPTSQQRSIDQSVQTTPQLSREDIDRITQLANQAKLLTPNEQKQLRGSVQRKLKGALAQGNLNQAQYYTELLNQIGQESR